MRAALDPHRRLCELLPQASKTISFIDETHSLHVLVIRTRLAQEPLLRASIANSNAYTTHLTLCRDTYSPRTVFSKSG